MRRLALAAVTLALIGGGLTACSSDKERWCEHDATDTVVDNSYCEKNTPGYEWEEASSGTKVKTKKSKSSTSSKSK